VIDNFIVEFLFVVGNEGIPYIVHDSRISTEGAEKDSIAESVLISGFLSAIQDFLKSITNTHLKVIDGGTEKIIIHRGDKFSVAAISKLDLVNDVLRILEEIAEKFATQYNTIIESSNIIDQSIFEDFRPYLTTSILIDNLFTLKSNDIYRKSVNKILFENPTYIGEKYGNQMSELYNALDGEKTLYQILNRLNLFGSIEALDKKLLGLYRDNLVKKVPDGERKLLILNKVFTSFINHFSEIMKKDLLLSIINEIYAQSENPFMKLFKFNSETLNLDLNEIRMLLQEDPTMALSPAFVDLVDPLSSFIAKIRISGEVKSQKINSSIQNVIGEIENLYPGDPFINLISTKLDILVM